MSDLTLQLKLELALCSYAFTFGGIFAPIFLKEHPDYFDALAWFATNPLATATEIDGMVIYPGHSDVDLLSENPADVNSPLRRLVITCSSLGGATAYAGNYEAEVEMLIVSRAKELDDQQALATAVSAIFDQERLPLIQMILNAPAVGEDLRAVKGFGLDGWEFKPQLMVEGRNAKENRHGMRLQYTAACHLE